MNTFSEEFLNEKLARIESGELVGGEVIPGVVCWIENGKLKSFIVMSRVAKFSRSWSAAEKRNSKYRSVLEEGLEEWRSKHGSERKNCAQFLSAHAGCSLSNAQKFLDGVEQRDPTQFRPDGFFRVFPSWAPWSWRNPPWSKGAGQEN